QQPAGADARRVHRPLRPSPAGTAHLAADPLHANRTPSRPDVVHRRTSVRDREDGQSKRDLPERARRIPPTLSRELHAARRRERRLASPDGDSQTRRHGESATRIPRRFLRSRQPYRGVFAQPGPHVAPIFRAARCYSSPTNRVSRADQRFIGRFPMNSSFGRSAAALSLALLTTLNARPVLAQQGQYAAVQGHVVDQSGAAMPGVTVVVTHQGSGMYRQVVSNADGSYYVANMVPGPYKVTAELPGFKKYEQAD